MNGDQQFLDHVIAFGREGEALDVNTLRPYTDRKYFDSHIQHILSKIRKFQDTSHSHGEKTSVLFYVHGALNTRKRARAKAAQEYKKILDDGKYPIFINWDAGMLSAYGEHLFWVRQGRKTAKWGIVTSPFYFLYDIAHAFIKFPLTWGYQIRNRVSGESGFGAFERNAAWNNVRLRKIFETDSSQEGTIQISSGSIEDSRTFWKKIQALSINMLMAPFQLAISPFLASAGTNAWNIYKRRTYNLFRMPREFDVRHERKHDSVDLPAYRRTGDLAYFLDAMVTQLVAKSGQDTVPDSTQQRTFQKEFCIELVGHSTGAIVLNNLITEYPDLDFSRIVYMGAACSIRDVYRTVIPYLIENQKSRFYVLALDPRAEMREMLSPWLPVVPTGSLLAWLDIYFTNPPQNLDRTLGQWINLMAAQHIFPKEVRNRVTLKKFEYANDGHPQKHGEFNHFGNFHKEEFWSVS